MAMTYVGHTAASELSQWLSHDDSTINIVIRISIIIIITNDANVNGLQRHL